MGAWEIYTYGGGDTLLQLFNGLVAILGDNNFLVLLKLTALITVIWVIIEALFMKRPISIQPFLVVILVFYILFLPRVNVIVTDRIDPSNSGVVANVPIGLGFTASLASTTGDWMSRAFETVFTLPNDLQYTTNGLLFGSNLLRAASQFEITDSRLAGNVSEFMQQCVFYDILTGFYTWGDIVNSTNLWTMLQGSANPGRSFQYLDNAGDKIIVTCPAGAAVLNTDWANEITQAQSIYGNRMFPGDPLAQAKFLAALPVSYAYMSNISTTAADAIRQNMMGNAVKRSLTRFAARADASAAAQDLALAQAEAQRSTSYSVLGELAGETLPLLRNVFEVLIYGLFPMFLILMFTPAAGKALLFYLKSLFWLQLWAPLYALLNLIMTSYSAKTGEAVATLPGGGQELTLATTTALGAVNADIAAIASYMAWMIPLISWGVVNAGAGMSMSMLAAGLGSITQQAGSRAAADVSHGNISMGTVGMYNQNAFKTDMAPVNAGSAGSVVDHQGTKQTVTPAGGQYEQYAKTDLGFGVQMTNAMRSGVNTQLSESQQSLWQNTAAYSDSLAVNYNNMQRFMAQRSSSTGYSNDYQLQDGTSASEEFGNLTSIADNFAQKYGVSNQQSVAMLGAAGAGAKIPLTKIGAELKAQFANTDNLQKAWEEAKQINTDTNFSDRYQSLTSATQTEAARVGKESNNSLARDIAAGLTEQNQYRDDVQASQNEVNQWQEAQSRVNEQGFSFSGKLEAAVKRFMIEEEGRSPHEVSNIVAGHNQGNVADTATLADSVSHFAQQHGLDLAGIQAAPTSDAVTRAGDANREDIAALSQNISTESVQNNEQVDNSARNAGIPTENTIQQNVTAVVDESIADMNATTNMMDKGSSRVIKEGDDLEGVVNEKQEVYSAGAAPSIHETMDQAKKKLTNVFKDAFD